MSTADRRAALPANTLIALARAALLEDGCVRLKARDSGASAKCLRRRDPISNVFGDLNELSMPVNAKPSRPSSDAHVLAGLAAPMQRRAAVGRPDCECRIRISISLPDKSKAFWRALFDIFA